MRDKIMRPIVLVFSLALVVFSAIIPSFEKVHAMYGSSILGNGSFAIANWNVNVSLDGVSNLEIDLKDSLITNNYSMDKVVPGTKGAIGINFNFTGTEVEAVYTIKANTNNILPSNIKFYSDSAMTNEVDINTGINGVVALNSSQNVDVVLYWQWVFTDDNENEWMDKDLVLNMQLNATQKIDEGI